MDCIKALLGNKYPKYTTKVIADDEEVAVVATMELSPNHVNLDKPDYLSKKFKKVIPALSGITVDEPQDGIGPIIVVAMSIKPHFNAFEDVEALASMANTIANIAEDRLSESEVINNIGNDCKPWFNNGKDEAE